MREKIGRLVSAAKSEKLSSRDEGIDAFRILAFVGVVLIHAASISDISPYFVIPITYGLASLTYRMIEQPSLKLRPRRPRAEFTAR